MTSEISPNLGPNQAVIVFIDPFPAELVSILNNDISNIPLLFGCFQRRSWPLVPSPPCPALASRCLREETSSLHQANPKPFIKHQFLTELITFTTSVDMVRHSLQDTSTYHFWSSQAHSARIGHSYLHLGEEGTKVPGC